MNREQSIEISAKIGNIINTSAPVIGYSGRDIEEMMRIIGNDIDAMREIGMYNGDPEALFVANAFCKSINLSEFVDNEYLISFYRSVQKLNSKSFLANPYISEVRYNDVRYGNLFLTYGKYEKGELFQYDMPDFSKRLVVPKIGFFDASVRFPTIYEGTMPWMSVCPSETSTIDGYIGNAFGRVLVLGLGLGYFPFRISFSKYVEKIVVVEINENIIRLVKENVFPFFHEKGKFEFICADAIKYLKELKDGAFDYCFADIWEGVRDGLPLYEKIKEQENRLKKMRFDYWIEPQLIAFKNYRNEG